MKNRTSISISLIALLLAMGTYTTHAQSTAPSADIPRTISYQGRLSNPDRSPVLDGTYPITVSLCANPDGTGKVWQETYSTSVTGGVFNLYLGSGKTPLPDPAIMNAPLWIATQIGDNPLMSPLSPLSASPYALNVSNGAITTGKLADGAVTAEKVNMPYISGVEINDQKVSGVGTVLKLKSSDDITLNYDEATNSVTIASKNGAASGNSHDSEKGGSVLDAVYGTTNWLGRDLGFGGGNYPSFQTPYGTYNTLGGGYVNTIGANANYSGIAAGQNNSIDHDDHAGFIGGGEENSIGPLTQWSVIAGGHLNSTTSTHATIGGGHENTITGGESTIGGGWANIIVGSFGFLGGGESNSVSADHATIGGGYANAAQGYYSAIPGGDNVKTTGYAHTGVGFYNAPRGFLPTQPTTPAIATINDPLFMVGNGTPASVGGTVTRSNAFEVSYNGHSVVYDVNGATRTPIKGATYVDNVVYAWGDINGNGTINAQFGITSVTYLGPGVYLIRIGVNDPVTGAPVTLNNASITTTPIQEGVDPGWLCYMMTTTRIGNPGPNQFIIRVKNINCVATDAPFMFKVTGRP